MAKKKSAGGRKPLWEVRNMDEMLEAVEGWALQGYTDAEIMKMLDVGKNVFYKWKSEKEEFKDALKKGRYISNGEIINSAYRQAMGYKTVEIKREKQWATDHKGRLLLDDNGQPYQHMVVTEEKIKDVAPNATMTIFMLKNRMPDQFRDKQHLEHSGTVGNVSLDHMTDDELEKAIKQLRG